ncbi:hypothetical protein SmaMPs15_000048 [Stenotrophomonas maltophilia phage vB_SmaM_Ps15]|uniref:Uncharacterized protein n=1 Tax=Stenotrophomonas maltophilia phage vB_SmaM_Ps15 TaxID=3071007 RepID=A0AAE9FLG7_9CAUD|nr:hypothetical protein PQC01_gp048 [Stenotrophomonas maltophilia phage vB_SmaM_Ps15]UMO77199.1 hypothetical protein SmaMPs15_000048 [Stenotrophomonas maltophilia phage vB_SmaM_Ps15]
MKIDLNVEVRHELLYKLSIALDEPDILESYGISEDAVEDLMELVEAGHPHDLTEKELQIAYGELSNSAEIDYANWKHDRCNGSGKSYKRLKKALEGLEAYAEAHGYDKGE